VREDYSYRVELDFVLEHNEFCVPLTNMTVFEKTCYYIMCLSRVIVYIVNNINCITVSRVIVNITG
jgi:hypothetical protein